jgi:hypothetical protein
MFALGTELPTSALQRYRPESEDQRKKGVVGDQPRCSGGHPREPGLDLARGSAAFEFDGDGPTAVNRQQVFSDNLRTHLPIVLAEPIIVPFH